MTQILSKITDEELEFCELFYYPIALAECLFSNADNLAEFDEDKYCEIRRYQAPLLSFDHFIDVENDARLDTKRKKFQARKNVADIYCFGGRGYGKSWALIIIDLLLYLIYAVGEQCLVASVDMNHIEGVLSKVKSAFESHPFIKLFYKKASATTSKYYLETKNGVTIKSVNANPTSADEGKKAWYGPHANRIYIEEASLLSTESAKASRDSEAEIGAVKRWSGMCIKKGSKIMMADMSSKNIEDIQIGDKILAWDDNKSNIAESIVLNKVYSGKKDVIGIKTDNSILYTTTDHKLLVRTLHDTAWRYQKAANIVICPYLAKRFPFIINKVSYYEGVLYGLLLADGSCQTIKGVKADYKQYSLFQSDEVDFFRWLLQYLNIKYSEDIHFPGRTGTFSKKNHFVFRIRRESNYYIEQIKEQLNYDNDTKYGFLAGFIIGDGCIGSKAALSLDQCEANKWKMDLIIKTMNELNIKYNYKTYRQKERKHRLSIYKFQIPFMIFNVKKCLKYKERTLKIRRANFPLSIIKLGGFKANEDVYDLTTQHGNFIANGLVVHNCNFNSFSPAGEIYYDKSNYPKVVNSPQLVNPTFTAEKEEERAKEFGGKSSIEFRQFVLGEVLGDSIKVVDLEKVNFNREKPVISFEINDDNFVHFRELIVVNRPEIAELGYIASDVSDVNITEILLIYKWNHQYHYRYKITLRGLDDTKHKTIFKWLINKAGIDYTSIDHSVDENEYVLCKINKTIKYLKFKEIDKYIKENKQCLIEVPTFNDDKLEWKRAKLIKHWHEGEMCKVTTSPGNYNVRVTDSHSIMIYTKDGIKEKYVKDIKTNDWMLSPKNFNIENKEYQIVKYKLPKKNKYSQDIYKDLKVDEKFAYLLGWAVAEGSSKTTSYQLGMGGDEEDKANELLNLHREIFNIESGYLLKCKKEKINTPYIQGRRLNVNLDRLCVVFGGGQGNKELFLNLCGSGAKNKQVPEVIFNSPIMVQKEFLRGLFEGDGNLRRNRYTLKVVSEKLRNEVMTLLQMTGEFPSYYDIPDQGRIFYVVSYAKNSQTKGKKIGVPYKILDIQNGKKRINEKIYKYNFGKEKKIKFDKLMNGDWLFEKVIKKEKYRYSGWVYDFEVEDNHTFVAGVGSLLCHNTDAMGRVLVNYLQKEFGESFVYGIGFNEKIKTDIEIDEKTHKPKRVKGDFVYKEEDVSIWSVRCLLRLLYDGKLELAYDVAIEKQLSKLVAEQRITKLIYRVKSKDDHAFQALTCFSILEFKLEFDHITEARKKKMIPVLGVGA